MPLCVGALILMLAGSDAFAIDLLSLGDVPLEFRLTADVNLSFSGDGRCLLVERLDCARDPKIQLAVESTLRDAHGLWCLKKVISIAGDGMSLTVTERPDGDGAWRVAGRVVASKSERWFTRTELPPKGPAVLKRTEIFPPGYDFEFIEATEAETAQQRAILQADGMRFEDGRGFPVFPGVELHRYLSNGSGFPGREGLFAIKDGSRIEATFPGAEGVTEFFYDSLRERMLVPGGPSGVFIYDLKRSKRWVVGRPEDGCEKMYYLIPGHDGLVLHQNFLNADGDDIVGTAMFLCDLKGAPLREFPRLSEASDRKHYPVLITCSQEMIAYGFASKGKHFIRVYRILPEAR